MKIMIYFIYFISWKSEIGGKFLPAGGGTELPLLDFNWVSPSIGVVLLRLSGEGHIYNTNTGNVYVCKYCWVSRRLSQIGQDINGNFFDKSGWSVSLSNDGETVANGALFNNDDGSEAGQVLENGLRYDRT